MNLPLFVAMTAEILPPLAAFCHRQLPEFVAICRRRGAISSHFNFHLLLTDEFSAIGLFCPVMTETAQRKRGGKAFHSILEPHFDFIRELRQRRKTWQEIADLLFSEKGIRVTFYAPYLFYRRRLKRAAKPHWENAEIVPNSNPPAPTQRPAGRHHVQSPLPKPNPFKRPNIKNINTDQEFT